MEENLWNFQSFFFFQPKPTLKNKVYFKKIKVFGNHHGEDILSFH